jgi:hypothetical protein
MVDWVNSPAEILTVLSIAAMVLAALMWLIKAVQAIQHETKPNSGASMRDAIDRIERTVEKLNDKLDGHIDWHMDREK